MTTAKRLGLAVACVFFLATADVKAQVFETLSRIGKAKQYFDVAMFYGELPDLFGSFNTCLSKGFGYDRCRSVFNQCAMSEVPIGTIAGAFLELYQFRDVFKVNCSGGTSGVCFACCFVPGSSYGCHTAFLREWRPYVINCNPNYGGGTHEAGPTLVVDPDPEPGQACLYTPQTCDHIGICHSGKTPAQIEAINGDAQHVMKSIGGVNSRATAFGSEVMEDWSNFLSDYHTSYSAPSDSIRQRVQPLSELGGFITGRGCAGWKHKYPESFPADWSEPDFRIDDENGNYANEVSRFNGLRQLGLLRLLASVPNLAERWKHVESQVWTPAAIEQYLAPVGDPDAVLLQSMSPVALDILRRSTLLQDYRLLAVPLPGETVSPRFFNGCLLADPPTLDLSFTKKDSLGIDLQVTAADSAGSSAKELDLLVLWGDGGVTRLTVPAGGQLQTVSHDYKTGGRYQVLAIAQNEAGLKTIGALVADTAGTGTNAANAPVPILSEIQLVDLRAQIDAYGNTFSMMFEMEGWTSSDQGYALGISRALSVPVQTGVSFGTVAGWNMQAVPLQSVTIRPSRFGEGYLNGFQGVYFSLDRIRVGVYSTQDNGLRFQDVPVTAQMVRLYPAGSSMPVLLTQPTYTPDGRLKIPVEVGGVRYARVDLIFPGSVFTQAIQGPVTEGNWTGVVGTLQEVKPGDGDEPAPPYPLELYTLTPCRLVDTRGSAGALGAPALLPFPDRTFALTGACGIPSDAKALSLNVTVTQGGAGGSLRIQPANGSLTPATVISFASGATRANNALIGLADDGTGTVKVHLDASAPVHLILDVNGYFK